MTDDRQRLPVWRLLQLDLQDVMAEKAQQEAERGPESKCVGPVGPPGDRRIPRSFIEEIRPAGIAQWVIDQLEQSGSIDENR